MVRLPALSLHSVCLCSRYCRLGGRSPVQLGGSGSLTITSAAVPNGFSVDAMQSNPIADRCCRPRSAIMLPRYFRRMAGRWAITGG